MATSSKNNVNLYETKQDIGTLKPYASIRADEFVLAINRYVSWAHLLGVHPDSAASLGRAIAAHIQLATDLRNALKESQEQHLYPNIVLSTSKYFAAMMLLAISRSRLSQQFMK